MRIKYLKLEGIAQTVANTHREKERLNSYTPWDVVKVHMGADDVVRESFRVDIFVEKVFEISSIATSIENDTFVHPNYGIKEWKLAVPTCK